MTERLCAIPLNLNEANMFVATHHRHSRPVVGHRFSIGAAINDSLVGVAIVGRPIARMLQDDFTAEVLRTCVKESAPKGTNSFLYARCWKAWKAMGGRKLITYTLKSESGASLRGAGWKVIAEVKGNRQWDTPSRPRELRDIYEQQKLRWEIV